MIYESGVGVVFLAAKTAVGRGAVFGSIGAGQFLVAGLTTMDQWMAMVMAG